MLLILKKERCDLVQIALIAASKSILTALVPDIMMTPMRTTVTLDTDVERLLRAAMHRHRRSFKDTLNIAIRTGLAGSQKNAASMPFAVKARPMGLKAGIDPASLNKLTDNLEVESQTAKRPKK